MTDMDRAGAVDEFLLDVEHFAKWMSQPLTPAMTYINERGKELALKAAALRAALSREPREEGPIVPISERPASDTNKVVEAIAFYADPKHYEVDPVSMLSCVERDGGAKAREATSALLYAHPPAPAGEKDRCPTCGQTPMRVRRFTREVPVIVDDDEPTPAERAAAGLHDAGGVGEAKAVAWMIPDEVYRPGVVYISRESAEEHAAPGERLVPLYTRPSPDEANAVEQHHATYGEGYLDGWHDRDDEHRKDPERGWKESASRIVVTRHAHNGGDPRRGESGEAIKAQGGAL